MNSDRREFLETGAKAAAGLSLLGPAAFGPASGALAPLPCVRASSGPRAGRGRALRILILGGTTFLGPHQIAYALGRGHAVTIFTRGQTEPTVHRELYRDVEQLIGDRENDLEALSGRSWDAVIDNSGRRVEWTRASAGLLRESAGLYLYTSSTGVYYPYLGSDIGEETELVREVPAGISDDQKLEYGYGVMKTLSEIEARRAFGDDRTIIVRPTYMMGPADRTDRFTYWPIRLSRGGETLVPGRPEDPVQYIDVRDVAGWMIRLIEDRNAGTFNAVGPASATGMHAFVFGAHAAFSSATSFVMIPDYGFLREQELTVAVPWIMPTGNDAGSARVSNARAIDNGLTLTPLAESARDIYEWWYSDAVPGERRAKLASGPESLMVREPGIIAAWRGRR